MNKIIPHLEAMLVCDSIITEADTYKKSLLGIFENIGAEVLPCTHYKLSVYVKFTDAQGKYQFTLDVLDLETSQILGKWHMPEMHVKDRLCSSALAFNLMGLTFPHEGRYQVRIFADEQFFGATTLNVMKKDASKK